MIEMCQFLVRPLTNVTGNISFSFLPTHEKRWVICKLNFIIYGYLKIDNSFYLFHRALCKTKSR